MITWWKRSPIIRRNRCRVSMMTRSNWIGCRGSCTEPLRWSKRFPVCCFLQASLVLSIGQSCTKTKKRQQNIIYMVTIAILALFQILVSYLFFVQKIIWKPSELFCFKETKNFAALLFFLEVCNKKFQRANATDIA